MIRFWASLTLACDGESIYDFDLPKSTRVTVMTKRRKMIAVEEA